MSHCALWHSVFWHLVLWLWVLCPHTVEFKMDLLALILWLIISLRTSFCKLLCLTINKGVITKTAHSRNQSFIIYQMLIPSVNFFPRKISPVTIVCVTTLFIAKYPGLKTVLEKKISIIWCSSLECYSWSTESWKNYVCSWKTGKKISFEWYQLFVSQEKTEYN